MTIELPLLDVFGRGGALKSSWYGDCLPSRDFPLLTELYLQGRLDLDAFVSEEIGLDQVEEAFTKMHHGDVLRSRRGLLTWTTKYRRWTGGPPAAQDVRGRHRDGREQRGAHRDQQDFADGGGLAEFDRGNDGGHRDPQRRGRPTRAGRDSALTNTKTSA